MMQYPEGGVSTSMQLCLRCVQSRLKAIARQNSFDKVARALNKWLQNFIIWAHKHDYQLQLSMPVSGYFIAQDCMNCLTGQKRLQMSFCRKQIAFFSEWQYFMAELLQNGFLLLLCVCLLFSSCPDAPAEELRLHVLPARHSWSDPRQAAGCS